MTLRIASLIILVIFPGLAMASFSGNLNLSYQGLSSGAGSQAPSTFGQILNIYLRDRIFYSNDFTLGAFLWRTKISDRKQTDLRYRYTLNTSGYRYNLFMSYSPYKIQIDSIQSLKVRVFQAALNLRPKLFPEIMASYASNRQYSTDKQGNQNSLSYSWNVGTQFSKAFGNFRGTYQRQISKFNVNLSQEQKQQTLNLGYDISKRFPWSLGWSASYNFIGSRNESPGSYKYNNRTHLGAIQVGRSFGRWISMAASSTARASNIEKALGVNRIRDFYGSFAATVNPIADLALTVLRGYSSSRFIDDTTIQTTNDYVSYSGAYEVEPRGSSTGRLAVSRAIYFRSALGPTTIDAGTIIFDAPLYRQTTASLNLGISHNNKTFSGHDKYQITRSIGINSKLSPKMSADINYQSSLAADNLTFLRSNTNNLSINFAHFLKPYFNYSIGYRRSVFKSGGQNSISNIGAAINYLITEKISLLASFSQRNAGKNPNPQIAGRENSFDGTLNWNMTRRSSATLNYSVSGNNTGSQTRNYGGFYTLSF